MNRRSPSLIDLAGTGAEDLNRQVERHRLRVFSADVDGEPVPSPQNSLYWSRP
jgi:hypothetical protein